MSILFTPASIGGMEIANRFVRSATGESAATHGALPPEAAGFYGCLAEDGIGLIITGHAYVRAAGSMHESMTGIHCDSLIPRLRELTDAVHACRCDARPRAHPARLVMQINHVGMNPPAAVNDLPSAGLRNIVSDFGLAAGRVKAAGFDGVQLHAAHGFLVSQFLSPGLNQRRDGWRGPGLAVAVLEAMRAEVGADFPVLVKFNCDGLAEDQLTPRQSAELARVLEWAGADAVEVSGSETARQDIHDPSLEAYFAEHARHIREALDIPVILVGGLRSMVRMENLVYEEVADFVSLCRPFIREPGLVSRFWSEREAGREDPVADCASCGQCWSSPELLNQCGVLHPMAAA